MLTVVLKVHSSRAGLCDRSIIMASKVPTMAAANRITTVCLPVNFNYFTSESLGALARKSRLWAEPWYVVGVCFFGLGCGGLDCLVFGCGCAAFGNDECGIFGSFEDGFGS